MPGHAKTEHPLDAATNLTLVGTGAYEGTTSEAYWNLAGPFGGIVAATLLRAVLKHPDRIGEPIALTVNFCAPIASGKFEVTATPTRTNRSTQHWEFKLVQGEGALVAASGTAITASRPQTWEHHPVQQPAVPAAKETPVFATSGLKWLEQYEFRFARGAPQLQSTPAIEAFETLSHFWVKDALPRDLDYVSLAALSDTPFARIFQARGAIVPFGTVSLTTYFHGGSDEIADQGSTALLGVADAHIFHRGFHDQSAQFWSAQGRLLATSNQIVYFRD